ncbi:hypothetical protein SAMN05421644_10648 [Allochromatium warmingii]|uniref:Uncharacterized protein n=1 Tax=Allochromatium warmingii TaxID=61595 RepID=A0A1H3CMJ5_ALLWA|nr:hypothetical protein SAMN05421644_10648 [Allochromatium warmingii]
MSVWEKYELILDLITLIFRNSDARPIRRAGMCAQRRQVDILECFRSV